jgi:hypothetical protein
MEFTGDTKYTELVSANICRGVPWRILNICNISASRFREAISYVLPQEKIFVRHPGDGYLQLLSENRAGTFSGKELDTIT